MESHERIFVIDQIKEGLEKLQTWQLLQLLTEIKKDSESSLHPNKCSSCGAPIIWSKTKSAFLNQTTGAKHNCPQNRHSPSASIMGLCKCPKCNSKFQA
jgi:hypothetical protein